MTARPAMAIRATARPRAKVNLTLAVSDRRADGYHDLLSLFLLVGVSDRLVIELDLGGTADRLRLLGGPEERRAELESPDNLVLRAIGLARGQGSGGWLRAELEKQIPVAAGLGGGSADAAAALHLAATVWAKEAVRAAEARPSRAADPDAAGARDIEAPGMPLDPGDDDPLEASMDRAAAIGSDVPFFASGAALALVGGRGEQVEPLPSPHPVGVLLVTPQERLSTGVVFGRFDRLPRTPSEARGLTLELAAQLAAREPIDLVALSDRFRDANDLWPAAVSIAPSLTDLRATLEQRTGRPWIFSGAGSTLFTFYACAEEASAAGRRLVSGSDRALIGATVIATDLDGPEPCWRST